LTRLREHVTQLNLWRSPLPQARSEDLARERRGTTAQRVVATPPKEQSHSPNSSEKVKRAPRLTAVTLAASEETAGTVSTTRCDVRLPLQLSAPLPPSSEEPLASGVEGIEFRETFSLRVGETEAETNRHSLTLDIEARKTPSPPAREPSCSEEHSGP